MRREIFKALASVRAKVGRTIFVVVERQMAIKRKSAYSYQQCQYDGNKEIS
jgi:hypothetical protein